MVFEYERINAYSPLGIVDIYQGNINTRSVIFGREDLRYLGSKEGENVLLLMQSGVMLM